MRTADQIEQGFKDAMSAATRSFIGEKISEENISQLTFAVEKAARNYYNSLSLEEIEYYDIKPPRPRVVNIGHNISIEDY